MSTNNIKKRKFNGNVFNISYDDGSDSGGGGGGGNNNNIIIPIANDLVTTDPTIALGASQGVVLKQMIDDIIVKDYQGEIDTLKNDVSTLKSDVSSLKNKVSTLESKVSTLQDDMTSVKDRVTTVEDKVTTLETDMTDIKNRTSTLETAMETAQNDIATLNSRMSSVEGRLSALETTVGTMQIDIATLQSNLSALNATVTALSATVGGLSTSVTLLQATIAAMAITISGKQDTLTLGPNMEWGLDGSLKTRAVPFFDDIVVWGNNLSGLLDAKQNKLTPAFNGNIQIDTNDIINTTADVTFTSVAVETIKNKMNKNVIYNVDTGQSHIFKVNDVNQVVIDTSGINSSVPVRTSNIRTYNSDNLTYWTSNMGSHVFQLGYDTPTLTAFNIGYTVIDSYLPLRLTTINSSSFLNLNATTYVGIYTGATNSINFYNGANNNYKFNDTNATFYRPLKCSALQPADSGMDMYVRSSYAGGVEFFNFYVSSDPADKTVLMITPYNLNNTIYIKGKTSGKSINFQNWVSGSPNDVAVIDDTHGFLAKTMTVGTSGPNLQGGLQMSGTKLQYHDGTSYKNLQVETVQDTPQRVTSARIMVTNTGGTNLDAIVDGSGFPAARWANPAVAFSGGELIIYLPVSYDPYNCRIMCFFDNISYNSATSTQFFVVGKFDAANALHFNVRYKGANANYDFLSVVPNDYDTCAFQVMINY